MRFPFYTFDLTFDMEVIRKMDYIEMEWGADTKKKALYLSPLQI